MDKVTEKGLVVKTPYSTYKDCYLRRNGYKANKKMELELWNDEDGPIATLTVCLPYERGTEEDEAYVDTNNCPWAIDFLKAYGIAEQTNVYGHSGYCTYPLMKFDMDKVAMFER